GLPAELVIPHGLGTEGRGRGIEAAGLVTARDESIEEIVSADVVVEGNLAGDSAIALRAGGRANPAAVPRRRRRGAVSACGARQLQRDEAVADGAVGGVAHAGLQLPARRQLEIHLAEPTRRG